MVLGVAYRSYYKEELLKHAFQRRKVEEKRVSIVIIRTLSPDRKLLIRKTANITGYPMFLLCR